jgi:type II secretory pathway pseudopilin PulG
MKRAFLLIEIILSVVIIGIIFGALVRVFEVSNKSLDFSNKEDAIFVMMAKMADISLKEYDYKNIFYDDILLVNDPPKYVLDCNASSGYRVGGFVGSRNCKDKIFESSIAYHTSGEYGYIDGYNGVEENVSSGHKRYWLRIRVGYSDEWKSYGDSFLDFNFTSRMDDNKTNIKRAEIEVGDEDGVISKVDYYSANIGHIKINSIRW